ncbi:unnamed protein product [Gadus morhua 'NCC']
MVGESRRWSWRLLAMWMPVLLLWITCFPPMAPGVAGTSGGVRTGSHVMPGRLGDGRALLSRAKRGWVWNQMFVLEEFSGPDPILVGRTTSSSADGRDGEQEETPRVPGEKGSLVSEASYSLRCPPPRSTPGQELVSL